MLKLYIKSIFYPRKIREKFEESLRLGIKLKDEDLVREVISLIEKENLSSEETKQIVKKLQNKKNQKNEVDILFKKVKSFGNKILLITDEKEKETTKIKLAEIKDFIEGLLKKLL